MRARAHPHPHPHPLLLLSYWANLKLWFKQKISKEEFDLEARRLLAQENGNLVPCPGAIMLPA